MASRPSEPLLGLIRKVAKAKGMNTAALARAAGLERGHLKHVLAGSEPLTVDELVVIAQVLELGPAELGAVPTTGTATPEAGARTEDEAGADADEEVAPPRRLAAVVEPTASDPITAAADPLGNHAAQVLRLGLALGCDIHMILDSAQVASSGVPPQVLQQYKERLPIRLDAAYHRHHALRFLPDLVSMTLSFDALYTCHFPWASIQQVTLFPLPPERAEPEPEEEEAPEGQPLRRGHLRLVE